MQVLPVQVDEKDRNQYLFFLPHEKKRPNNFQTNHKGRNNNDQIRTQQKEGK